MDAIYERWKVETANYQDSLVFVKAGDRVITFRAIAAIAAEELNLTITYWQEVKTTDLPYTRMYEFLDKLVSKGYKVVVSFLS